MSVNTMKKFGKKEYKRVDGENDYNPVWTPRAHQHNARIVVNGILVPFSDIDMNNRTHQSRVMDVSKGHVINLANDIASNNLQILPTVEWDSASQKFVVLAGHHRLLAIQKLKTEAHYKKEKCWQGDIPVAVLEFKRDTDRIKYLAADNNHKPARLHTYKDGVHFLSRLDGAGEFANCANETSRKKMAYELLSEFFPRLNGVKKNEVYMSSFNVVRTYKNWSTKEIAQEKSAIWNIPVGQHTAGNTAYVNGNHTQWGNSVSNALNTHCNNIENGSIPKNTKLKIKLLAHVQMTDKATPESFCQSLRGGRKNVVDNVTLKNKYLYGPTGIACVEEIYLLPQLLTSTAGYQPETKRVKLTWDAHDQKFV